MNKIEKEGRGNAIFFREKNIFFLF